jgi:hypothetical protein
MRKIQLLSIALIVSALTFASLTFYHYSGFPSQGSVPQPDIESINVPTNPPGTQPIPGGGVRARVVFDAVHENAFSANEISSLLEIFSSFSVEYEIAESPEDLFKALKYSDSLIIISPVTAYTKDEVASVKEFLGKGGKLGLIYDPTRGGSINSLSTQFDVVFVPDYLYNMEENAGNYRNIFIKEFRPSRVTSGIERITLFTASSISSDGGVALTDEETTSSSQGEGPHTTIVLIDDSIFAISDQSFLEHPNDRVTDNSGLISNIAGFLGDGRRRFTLEDFPHFYRDVDVRYSNESLIDEALMARRIFVDAGISSRISDRASDESVYIGLLNDSESELKGLEDIIVNNALVAGNLEYDLNSTAFIYLRDKNIWILSNEEAPLNDLINILSSGEIKYNQVSENLAILPYEPTIVEKLNETEGGVTFEGNETTSNNSFLVN